MNVTLLLTKSNMMLPGQWMFKIGWPGMGPLNIESANSFIRKESARRHHFILDQREYEVCMMRLLNNKRVVELRHRGRMGGCSVGNLGAYVRILFSDVHEERRLRGSSFCTKEE